MAPGGPDRPRAPSPLRPLSFRCRSPCRSPGPSPRPPLSAPLRAPHPGLGFLPCFHLGDVPQNTQPAGGPLGTHLKALAWPGPRGRQTSGWQFQGRSCRSAEAGGARSHQSGLSGLTEEKGRLPGQEGDLRNAVDAALTLTFFCSGSQLWGQEGGACRVRAPRPPHGVLARLLRCRGQSLSSSLQAVPFVPIHRKPSRDGRGRARALWAPGASCSWAWEPRRQTCGSKWLCLGAGAQAKLQLPLKVKSLCRWTLEH